jgi:hypothetical protein
MQWEPVSRHHFSKLKTPEFPRTVRHTGKLVLDGGNKTFSRIDEALDRLLTLLTPLAILDDDGLDLGRDRSFDYESYLTTIYCIVFFNHDPKIAHADLARSIAHQKLYRVC